MADGFVTLLEGIAIVMGGATVLALIVFAVVYAVLKRL